MSSQKVVFNVTTDFFGGCAMLQAGQPLSQISIKSIWTGSCMTTGKHYNFYCVVPFKSSCWNTGSNLIEGCWELDIYSLSLTYLVEISNFLLYRIVK